MKALLPVLAFLVLFAPGAAMAEAQATPGDLPAAGKREGIVLAKAGHFPRPGTKLTKSTTVVMKDGVEQIKGGIAEAELRISLSESETVSLEYVSPAKIKSKVTAFENKATVVMNGENLPQAEAGNALLGKEVTITKAGAVWSAKLESGEPTEEEASRLSKSPSTIDRKDDKVYGTVPRKIGDVWTAEPKDTVFSEDDGKSPPTGEVRLTFKAVEEHAGKPCARIEGTLDMKSETQDDLGRKTISSLKGIFVVFRSLEDFVDLKIDFTGKMETKGPTEGGTSAMTADITIQEKNTVH